MFGEWGGVVDEKGTGPQRVSSSSDVEMGQRESKVVLDSRLEGLDGRARDNRHGKTLACLEVEFPDENGTRI